MSKPNVINELGSVVHEAGPGATSLLLQVLEHNRREAEHIQVILQAGLEQKVKELEAERDYLRKELKALRSRASWLLYGDDPDGYE